MNSNLIEKSKITVAFLVFLLGIILTSWYSYATEKERIEGEIDSKLHSIAQAVPMVLPDRFHDTKMQKNTISPDTDFSNIKKLSNFATATGAKYAYTVFEDDKKIRFSASSATQEELKTGKNLTRFFDSYDDADPMLLEALKSGQHKYASYEDKWGHFRSVFVPLKSQNGNIYAVGVDIEVGSINDLLKKAALKGALSAATVLLFAIPIAFLYLGTLRHHNMILEQKVIGATDELRTLNASLEDRVAKEVEKNSKREKAMFEQSKLAQMGQMMQAVAHHWRQPLNALGMYVQNIHFLYDMKELSKEDMDSFKTESMDVIQKMSKTIDSFRNLFLPDAQRLDFCVEDAINEVIMIVTPKMEGDNIELIDTKAGRHVVSGYKNEFKQVFLNLLANAADETVKQNSDVKKIEIYTVKKEDNIEISVKDSGGGIASELIDRIFEPYFTTKEQGSGIGIGLYMSKELIERHFGGTLRAENTEGGAVFTISLPVRFLG